VDDNLVDERGREEESTKVDGWMKESTTEASVLDERNGDRSYDEGDGTGRNNLDDNR
jgi:hypothetical protein